MFGAGPLAHSEDVRGNELGVQFDVVAARPPQITSVAKQFVDLARPLGRRAQPFGGYIDPTGVNVMRVEVDDDQYHVRTGLLAVTNQLFVGGLMELEIGVALQCRVLASNGV